MHKTPFGESLREPVRSVLRQIEDVSRLRDTFDRAALTRRCVIAARDLTIDLFAPALIERFAIEAPLASFRIVPWEADRLADQLATGACDLAIGVDPPSNDAGLRIRKLYEDDYVAVCARHNAPPGAWMISCAALQSSRAERTNQSVPSTRLSLLADSHGTSSCAAPISWRHYRLLVAQSSSWSFPDA
jgi:DNA-binding transcriptional LysR family regulator